LKEVNDFLKCRKGIPSPAHSSARHGLQRGSAGSKWVGFLYFHSACNRQCESAMKESTATLFWNLLQRNKDHHREPLRRNGPGLKAEHRSAGYRGRKAATPSVLLICFMHRGPATPVAV
jgi:hypothetical protein